MLEQLLTSSLFVVYGMKLSRVLLDVVQEQILIRAATIYFFHLLKFKSSRYATGAWGFSIALALSTQQGIGIPTKCTFEKSASTLVKAEGMGMQGRMNVLVL